MRAVVSTVTLMAAWGGAAALSGQSATGIQARQQALELEWSQELDTKKRVSPVRRVVNLLTKMREELEAERAKEAEMYDKMVCWCKTNDQEKTQAVAQAEAADAELSSEIESRAARFGELGTGIAKLKEEIQANQETLDKATAIREDEASKFRSMENDLVQYVTNLRNAVTVLSKHQGSSMLQLDNSLLSGLRVLLRDAALKYDLLAAGREERNGPVHIALLALRNAHAAAGAKDQQSAALLQALNTHAGSVSDALPVKFAQEVIARAAAASSGAFLQKQPAGFESRSSARSSEIFGVLQQMQQEFEEELTSAQKEELRAQEAFKELAAAKTAEIEAGKKKLDDMEVEHANNQKALSDAKENLSLTRQQRSEDVEFLRNLKLTCNDLDDQWQKRSQTRAAESQAVSEAIVILTEDDNREHLAKTVSLLQLDADTESVSHTRRVSAAAALRKAAQAPDFDADDLLAAWNGRAVPKAVGAAAGPRMQLATLATAVQLDAFTKVKELMDKMIADLKDQQAEEVTFKDHCNSELDSTERDLHEKGELKNDLEANLDRLNNLIQKLETEIQEHRDQIGHAQTEIKRAGEQREQENKEFQAVVADQRATQEILAKALMKLKDFYHKNIGNKVVFVQKAKQTPPVQFNDYKTNTGSNSVIGLLEQIIGDSKSLEAEATKDETSAQASYEAFVKDSNGLINSLQESVTKKTEAIATSKGEHAMTNADLESTVDELNSLSEYEADLHSRCDFVLKNFNIRQHARLQEIEAIQSAKAILSGAQ